LAATSHHPHNNNNFVPRGDHIDAIIGRSALSGQHQVIRHLSLLTGQLTISSGSAIAQSMTDFVTRLVTPALSSQLSDSPQIVSQIFRQVSDKTWTGLTAD
jgi:hypothetical protein